MSAILNAAASVLINTVDQCLADGQRWIVSLLDLPEGGGELSGWLEADVPLKVWQGWLVTGVGEVVWLPGSPLH